MSREHLSYIKELATIFVDSEIFADLTVPLATTVILLGEELGLTPFDALLSIEFKNGKLTLPGAKIAAIIKASEVYDFEILEHEQVGTALRFTKNGKPLEPIVSFLKTDADRMGLSETEFYQKQPATMYYWRAVSKGARMHCPELFHGACYTPEELVRGEPISDEKPLPDPVSPFDHVLEGESKYKGKKISEVPVEVLKKAALVTDLKKVTLKDRTMMICAIDSILTGEQTR
jgi:hypothetical protein